MSHSPRKGEKSELAVASELMMMGYGVSFPFGHNHPYDLIVDKGGNLYTVQVKTAKNEGSKRYYISADVDRYDNTNVDLLAGYSEDEKAAFYIPLDEASGKRQRVTCTDLERMGSEESRQRSNHISDYRFPEAVERV